MNKLCPVNSILNRYELKTCTDVFHSCIYK